MARPDAAFIAASRDFVCVRITDMQRVDLRRYQFDFDLTLAILLAHPDGRIYHRIGGRTRADPLAWMSMALVQRVMRETLVEHREYRAQLAASESTAPPRARPRTIYDIETFSRRIERRGKRPDCIHCHTIHEAQVRDRQARGTFSLRDVWIWPAPARVGLEMDAADQALVRVVRDGSPAAATGLRAGDRLLRLGDQRILTVHDLQWVLHRAPYEAAELPVSYRRGAATISGQLRCAPGWKRTDPLTWSWRPYKWPLRPAPGFGGPLLATDQKRALGLDPKAWACRVQYIVDWGDRPQQGRENRRRGLRKGDVVFAYDGRSDFATMDHFHAWTRLRKKRGERVTISILRGGSRQKIVVTLQ